MGYQENFSTKYICLINVDHLELWQSFSTGDNLYLNVNAQTLCRFDPCKYTTCLQGTAAKCVVNTKCHPVFLDAFGKIMRCKGMSFCGRKNHTVADIADAVR